MSTPAYLVLQDGHVFEGRLFGCADNLSDGKDVLGEVVFTTGMTGYLETLSDPSYYGQIVVQTFPLIGNYGVIPADFESGALWPRAYIVREWCEHPSNFRSEGDLDALLRERGVVGLSGIDTRSLTRVIRDAGVMNGAVTLCPDAVDRRALDRHGVKEPVAGVSTPKVVRMGAKKAKRRVVLWDFGAKANIARSLVARDCEVVVVPHKYTAKKIAAYEPDGIMLSNGPGDPGENDGVVAELRTLLEYRIPTFGICLGHQILAIAMGAKSQKLKYGHRGANQPVRDVRTGRVYITTQNHGYAVVPESIPKRVAEMRFVNANDGTCEGIDYKKMPAFGVQFHPEACAGPMDTSYLFDRFVEMMEAYRHAAR